MRLTNIRGRIAIAALIVCIGLPCTLALPGVGFSPLDEKIAALEAGAPPAVQRLLRRDRYAQLFFTNPAEMLSAEPRGVALTDNTFVHISFIAPNPADEVSCADIPREGLGTVLIAGQSNAENSTAADDLYRPRRKFYNFNIEDGRCYIARERALGTTGHGSSFALPLADDLLDRGVYSNVLIVPIAIGGSFIEEWRPQGRYFRRFRRAVDTLGAEHLAPSLVLWQHGEGNASMLVVNQTTGLFGDDRGSRPIVVTPELRDAARLNYERRFYEIVSGLRGLGMTAPIFASVSTQCVYGKSDPTIRAAQQALPDPAWGVYGGPDTDQISNEGRRDTCHFNAAGIQQVARAWTDVIEDKLRRSPPLARTAAMPNTRAVSAGTGTP